MGQRPYYYLLKNAVAVVGVVQHVNNIGFACLRVSYPLCINLWEIVWVVMSYPLVYCFTLFDISSS